MLEKNTNERCEDLAAKNERCGRQHLDTKRNLCEREAPTAYAFPAACYREFSLNKKSIREHIVNKKPNLKMWSVVQMIDGNPDECDFTKRFHSLPDAVAPDLDERYRGWKLGFASTLAIVPTNCFELIDGLIVY